MPPRSDAVLGVVLREVQRKIAAMGATAAGASAGAMASLHELMGRVERIRRQRPKDRRKLYALHVPEVECIGKGKARKPYEFGVKVNVAVTHKQGLMVGAQLSRQSLRRPHAGRAVGAGDDPDRDRFKSLTEQQRRWLKGRQAVEPAIGHLKHERDKPAMRCTRCRAPADYRGLAASASMVPASRVGERRASALARPLSAISCADAGAASNRSSANASS